MGTVRMGEDPQKSVTEAHGRLHDVENVYVGDGSVFVSAGGFNPSLTIMALSLRMARHIVEAGTGEVAAATLTQASAGIGLPNTSTTAVSGATTAVAAATVVTVVSKQRARRHSTTIVPDSMDDA